MAAKKIGKNVCIFLDFVYIFFESFFVKNWGSICLFFVNVEHT